MDNLRSDIEQLQRQFDLMKRQALLTQGSWDDPVQAKFYEQFIWSLEVEFKRYLETFIELERNVANIEKNINDLKNT
jgi:hypothetical protein